MRRRVPGLHVHFGRTREALAHERCDSSVVTEPNLRSIVSSAELELRKPTALQAEQPVARAHPRFDQHARTFSSNPGVARIDLYRCPLRLLLGNGASCIYDCHLWKWNVADPEIGLAGTQHADRALRVASLKSARPISTKNAAPSPAGNASAMARVPREIAPGEGSGGGHADAPRA